MSVIPAFILWKLTLSRTRMFSRCLGSQYHLRIEFLMNQLTSSPVHQISHRIKECSSIHHPPKLQRELPINFARPFNSGRRLPHLPPYLIQTTNLFWLSVLELIKMIWIHCQSNLTSHLFAHHRTCLMIIMQTLIILR